MTQTLLIVSGRHSQAFPQTSGTSHNCDKLQTRLKMYKLWQKKNIPPGISGTLIFMKASNKRGKLCVECWDPPTYLPSVKILPCNVLSAVTFLGCQCHKKLQHPTHLNFCNPESLKLVFGLVIVAQRKIWLEVWLEIQLQNVQNEYFFEWIEILEIHIYLEHPCRVPLQMWTVSFH